MTAPSQVSYRDVLGVWREADTIPEIEHAWLFDHLMPISGDPDGPTFEGWTLLSALAAQTERLRLGLLVTSNRFRPPAAEIGRDPASITRSIVLPVSYDHPGNTRDSIAEAIDAGFLHVVLGLPVPYPENVARWVTNELINKSA